MTHKKLRKIAALTGALLAVNVGAGVFAPCYAEYDFAAYAAESTEAAHEEYEIYVSKETEETRFNYTMGETLDIRGFYLTGSCKKFDENGKKIDETGFEHVALQELIDNGTVTLDIGDFYTDPCAGPRCLTINYGTASTEIWVSVENYEESHGMIIDSLPTKTDYILGEELDLTGAKISGYFSDGKNRYDWENADLKTLVEEGKVTINPEELYAVGEKSGERSVYFGYYNAFGSFSVNVTDPNEEHSLTLHSLPDKLTYKIGEKLDLTGAKFSAYSKLTDFYDNIPKCEVSEYVNNGTLKLDASEFDYTKPGTYTITLTYGHDTLFPDTESFEVTVLDEKSEEETFYISAPKTAFGINEELDFTGAYLIVAPNNDFDNTESYLLTDLIEKGLVTVDASSYNNQEWGSYPIYFTYKGETDSIAVTVSCEIPDDNDFISVRTNDKKTVYQIGEELDLTGMTFSGYKCRHGFHGHFMDCSLLEYVEKGVLELDASEFDNTTPGTYTIYVTYGMETDSFEVTVEGKKIVPTGDSNGDGDFTIADMVIVQKHIMGKKTAILSDWKCADLYEDGKIDVYDFIIMRENFVKNMK